MRIVMNFALADLLQILAPTQHAGRGAADLDVGFPAHGRKLEHRIERGHFVNADEGHIEHLAHIFHGGLREPAGILLLGAPEQSDHGRGLLAGGIIADGLFRPRHILRGEGEAFRLYGIKTANAHRSTSPNTISREPRTAETSASMWPRHMKSMACKWAKPGARSLQR